MRRKEIGYTHHIHEQERTLAATWPPEIGGMEWYAQSWTTKLLTEAAGISDICLFEGSSITVEYQLSLFGSSVPGNLHSLHCQQGTLTFTFTQMAEGIRKTNKKNYLVIRSNRHYHIIQNEWSKTWYVLCCISNLVNTSRLEKWYQHGYR